MTESGGLISQINDKSGNGKNGIKQTLFANFSFKCKNGRSFMRFDGADDYFNINSSVSYRTVLLLQNQIMQPSVIIWYYWRIIWNFSF